MVQIKRIWFDENRLWAEFYDGRTVDVPTKWFPNLSKGSPQQLDRYEIWGDNQYIHWPDLDEDISAETLISLSMQGLAEALPKGSG